MLFGLSLHYFNWCDIWRQMAMFYLWRRGGKHSAICVIPTSVLLSGATRIGSHPVPNLLGALLWYVYWRMMDERYHPRNHFTANRRDWLCFLGTRKIKTSYWDWKFIARWKKCRICQNPGCVRSMWFQKGGWNCYGLWNLDLISSVEEEPMDSGRMEHNFSFNIST